MSRKKTVGLVLLIAGVALFFFSHHISAKVAEARGEIAEGQRQVDSANQIFSMSPYTKTVGGQFTGSAQSEINAGTLEANRYDQLAFQIKILGVVLVVVGAGLLFLSKK